MCLVQFTAHGQRDKLHSCTVWCRQTHKDATTSTQTEV